MSGDRRQPRRRVLVRWAGFGTGLMLAPYGFLRPADAAPALPTPAEQISVGEMTTKEILKKYPQVKDGRLRFFTNVAKRLVAKLPDEYRRPWDYQYYVLDSKEVNAFAVPGGPIFMFTGLLAVMPTVDAVAAVTGHELAHIYLQHWARAYAKQVRRRRTVVLATLVAGNKSAALGWGAVISGVLGQKFSREEEDEADQYGLNNMVAAGYNPEGMVQLFQTLQKAGGNGGGPLGGPFLADHPMTSDRIKRTQQRIAQLGPRTYPPLTPLNYSALR